MDNTKGRRYTPTAQALHWLIALLIVVQFVLARMAAPLPLGAHKLALLAEHKSFGMTVLMLAVIRLAWRLKNLPPSLPTNMHRVERFLARFTHASFYVLLIAMPLSGWLMCFPTFDPARSPPTVLPAINRACRRWKHPRSCGSPMTFAARSMPPSRACPKSFALQSRCAKSMASLTRISPQPCPFRSVPYAYVAGVASALKFASTAV